MNDSRSDAEADGEEERKEAKEGMEGKEGKRRSHSRSRSPSDFRIASSPSVSHAGSSVLSSSASSLNSSSDVSSVHSTTDRFPYERNLLALQPFYLILRRLYACRDAVTYRAVALSSGTVVVLKVADSYVGKKDPKEVRLLTAVQGHERICRLVGWHPLLFTECSCMVTEYCRNDAIESTVFLSRRKQQRYMQDLLSALLHMHARNVLYRDVKPSNVLWNDAEQRATVIDFDVATFYDARRKHRSVVWNGWVHVDRDPAHTAGQEGAEGREEAQGGRGGGGGGGRGRGRGGGWGGGRRRQ